MDHLANGLAAVHRHGVSMGAWIAIFLAVWIPIMVGMAERRKRRQKDTQDDRMTPKPRLPIPGTEKDYRR